MRSRRPLALGILLAFAFAIGATRSASAQDTESGVELTLTEEGSETPWLYVGEQVTLIVPEIEQPAVVEVPEGLFVDQSGTQVTVEPGGSTFTIDEVDDDGAYPVVMSKLVKIPLIGTINVSSTKKPK